MTGSAAKTKVSIIGLERDLAHDLADALAANSCEVECFDSSRKTLADMIFCPADLATLARVRKLNPQRPVIVISRVPDVSAWLDALEASAADYCAAPFEPVQVRWLLDSHLAARRAAAVAA